MVKLNAFQIRFTDSSQAVYSAGQQINGHLFLDLNESMSMRAITLEFHGYANVHWTERRSSGSGKRRRTRTVSYTSNEVYFNQKVLIWGDGTGGGFFESSPVHPAGQHIYPFQYQLPPILPSSFEGRFGRVRYFIKGTIDKPWKFNHTTKVAFTVQTVYDLNLNPQARMSGENQASKTLCCCCCASGPISAMCQINRRGYVPGEFIVVNGEIDNKSNRAMTSTKLQLKMVTIFKTARKKRSMASVVANIQRGQLAAGDVETWSGERIHIPPLPPSELIHCNIIDMKYYISLIADPSGPAFDLECPIEIIIGTIPLNDVFSMYANSALPPLGMAPFLPPPMLYEDTGSSTSVGPAPPGFRADLYNNLPASSPSAPPPPSYAECAFGRVNIREEQDSDYTQGSMDYAPVYTYYSFANQQNRA